VKILLIKKLKGKKMFKTKKLLAGSLIATYALSGLLHASDYSKTSYYVAYDENDKTQYALVMPSVNRVYTHVAGDIANLHQIGSEFTSFPTYNNGNLCFPALASGKTGLNGASTMADKCYDVDFFYTQEEKIDAGMAFMLYYKTTDKLYEGIAGDATSFLVVKEGDVVTNVNSVTGKDFSNYSFDVNSATAVITPSTKQDLSGEITSNMTLTADKVWRLNGLVAVKNGATLTIEPGTTIIGKAGTGANTSYLVIDKGSKIDAAGTAEKPIIFTSETKYDGGTDEWGQWGGLTLIGNAANAQVDPYEVNSDFVPGTSNLADNSGVLTYVKILNSGITMEENKEINGLSFVGVGSGTTVDNITIDLSDDDGIEIWGGTVDLSNITISRCSDDHFDIDDGFSGTVTNLNITETTGNAAIEMSGDTAATFNGFNIIVNNSAKEGGIYFKKDGIGGYFNNGTLTYNTPDNGYGAIHSAGTFDSAHTSFSNVTLAGSNSTKFTGDSASSLESKFATGTSNIK